MENRILKALYLIEEQHKSQRILQVMKHFEKSEHRLIARLIDKLEDGKVIQEGTHETLVNVDGYYKELYLNQLSETSNLD